MFLQFFVILLPREKNCNRSHFHVSFIYIRHNKWQNEMFNIRFQNSFWEFNLFAECSLSLVSVCMLLLNEMTVRFHLWAMSVYFLTVLLSELTNEIQMFQNHVPMALILLQVALISLYCEKVNIGNSWWAPSSTVTAREDWIPRGWNSFSPLPPMTSTILILFKVVSLICGFVLLLMTGPI